MNTDQVITQLKQVWQTILGVQQPDMHANFFNSGGDSLLMAALIQQLHFEYDLAEQQFCDMPMITFHDQLTTLKRLLNIDEASIISVMRRGNVDTSLVFIHPIGGTLFAFMPLIKKLQGNQQILGIHDPLMRHDYQLFSTVEAQAQFYADALRSHIGTEVIIAGYSSGGTIGCEITKSLQRQGITVKHLILFDSWAKMPFGLGFRNNFKNIITRQIDKIRPHAFLDQEQIRYWHDVLWNRMRLILAYKPSKTPVNASVFIPQEAVPEYQVDPAAYENWKSLFNHVDLLKVTGNHENMLDEVDISPIAKHINLLLTM